MSGQIERELQNTRPVGPPEIEAALNVLRTADLLNRRADEALLPVELRRDEYNVLRILRGAGAEGRTPADIRGRLLTDSGRLPAIMHNLKTRGLAEGALQVVVTAAGLELLAKADRLIDAELARLLGPLGEARVRQLTALLEEIRRGA